MSHQDNRQTLITWLNDAYGMELAQIRTLENHLSRAGSHPEVQARLRQHLAETRRHSDLIKDCIERMGSSPSNLKSTMGSLTGFFSGVMNRVSKDELVKNELLDYASEAFEIACYRALSVGARSVGEEYVAETCERILRDEEEMARWLEQQIPTAVHEYLAHEAAA